MGLLLLAFALRVCQLSAQSLWYDEGVSWYMTRMSLPALTVWTANDIQPPLYYYLLWLWVRLAGTSEYALRFPSAFFGVLTVPLLWITARRWLGYPAAWLAALLLTLSPLHVYYAQEARMYTLLTFLGLLSSYLLLRTSPPTPLSAAPARAAHLCLVPPAVQPQVRHKCRQPGRAERGGCPPLLPPKSGGEGGGGDEGGTAVPVRHKAASPATRAMTRPTMTQGSVRTNQV